MMHRRCALSYHGHVAHLAVVLLIPGIGTANAQQYVPLPADVELDMARSAAPEEVSKGAAIWVLHNGRYELAVQGVNGNACIVARSYPKSLEPICYDSTGAATVLLWEFEFLRQRLAGKESRAAQAVVLEAVQSGRLPTPGRPAMTYMLSSSQHLFDPESGQDAGHWKPHLMLYIPGLTYRNIGLSGPTGELMIEHPGTPMAHLIVVMPAFTSTPSPR